MWARSLHTAAWVPRPSLNLAFRNYTWYGTVSGQRLTDSDIKYIKRYQSRVRSPCIALLRNRHQEVLSKCESLSLTEPGLWPQQV